MFDGVLGFVLGLVVGAVLAFLLCANVIKDNYCGTVTDQESSLVCKYKDTVYTLKEAVIK